MFLIVYRARPVCFTPRGKETVRDVSPCVSNVSPCVRETFPDTRGNVPALRGDLSDNGGNVPDDSGDFSDNSAESPEESGEFPEVRGGVPDDSGNVPAVVGDVSPCVGGRGETGAQSAGRSVLQTGRAVQYRIMATDLQSAVLTSGARTYDFVVLGSGIAGLFFALEVSEFGSVALSTLR